MIPETLAEDGDPLDAMVAVSEPTFPGCVIPVKPIALFKMRDEKGVDDKVICVPFQDPNWNHAERLEDLPEQLRDEISHFFAVYKTLEQKDVEVDGWYSREDALQVIEEAQAALERALTRRPPRARRAVRGAARLPVRAALPRGRRAADGARRRGRGRRRSSSGTASRRGPICGAT